MKSLVYFSLIFLCTFAHGSTHRPIEFLQAIKNTRDEGKDIVEHWCATCHASNPVISVGAPRSQIKADWSARLKQGISVLLDHTSDGLGAMPARGGCFECSDEQLMKAIKYMTQKETKDKK